MAMNPANNNCNIAALAVVTDYQRKVGPCVS